MAQALPGVGFAEESFHRDIDEFGICQVLIAVGKGELFDLDQQVEIRGRVVAERDGVAGFEHVEHLERGDALRVGRHLVSHAIPVRGMDGFDPGRAVVLKIFHGKQAAVFPGKPHDLFSKLAAVKNALSLIGDLFEARGEILLPEDFPRSRRSAVHQVMGRGIRMGQEFVFGSGPFPCGLLGHGKPFLRISDRRLEKVLEAHRAVTFDQRGPAIERSGYRDREHPAVRDFG